VDLVILVVILGKCNMIVYLMKKVKDDGFAMPHAMYKYNEKTACDGNMLVPGKTCSKIKTDEAV